MEEATIWHVGDFSSKRQLIKEGFGWGYMPQHMIDTDLEEHTLVALNLGRGNKNSKVKIATLRKYCYYSSVIHCAT